MLILSRFRDQSVRVMVGGVEVARVLIVDVRGDKVRVGFTAGDEVKFLRGELDVHEAGAYGAGAGAAVHRRGAPRENAEEGGRRDE